MESNLYQSLGQVSSEEAGQIFRDHLRGCVRQMISEVMAAEVNELCGPKHQPSDSDHFRAGSSSGRVLLDGEREAVVRPRVRKRIDRSNSEEVVLTTYQAARDPSQLQESIVTALMHGVSTRDVEKIKPNSPGVGRSNVSRHWQSVGHKFVDELRGRDLTEENWAVVMLDGIRLSKDQLAVAAIGITTEGRKHVLDFELGSSESAEVARDLMRQLMKRGFHCDLSKKHWGELARLFKRLRGVQGKAAALEVVGELKSFLKGKNAESLRSLEEAGEDLIALQSLNVPSTLHRSLLSTNAIENSFRNTRNKLGRVTRFRAETDQATRWLSFALLEVEKGFRRISGHDDMPELISALEARKAD